MENRTALVEPEAVNHAPTCGCVACDQAYDDRVPARAVALWTFVAACEDVASAQPQANCDTCAGAGCGRCDGLGFALAAEWATVLAAMLAAVSGLCTDAGHERDCHCGGDTAGLAEVA